MSQFKVQKHQVAASLVLSTGAMRHGCFFVFTSMSHGGPERVGDLLNGASGFFPFQHGDGVTGQYHRNHLVMVTLPAGNSDAFGGLDVGTETDAEGVHPVLNAGDIALHARDVDDGSGSFDI